MSWTKRLPGLLAGAAVAVLAAGCLEDAAGGAGTAGPVATTQASEQLAELPTRAEDTGAHYDRDDWGDWTTKDGCSTRETVLAQEGEGERVGDGCRPSCPAAADPCWVSPYDGVEVRDASELQIDHRVPLAEAARSGARDWTTEQRETYYNDAANLVAVTIRSNASKSDGDPGTWRPSARDHWCAYATGYIAIKTHYELAVDQRERDALEQMLRTCRKR